MIWRRLAQTEYRLGKGKRKIPKIRDFSWKGTTKKMRLPCVPAKGW